MRWRSKFLLFLLCVTSLQSSLAAAAQRRSTPPPDYFRAFQSREDRGNLTRVVLRNGLTILIEEHPLDPLAAIGTFVVGRGAPENGEDWGLTRLMEQLYLYRSEAGVNMKKLGTALDTRGSETGVFFSSSGPADNALKILEFHADLLRDPQIKPAEIIPELEILIEEAQSRVELPDTFVKDEVLKLLYPDGAVKVGRRFQAQSLDALREVETARQKLTAVHKARYHPKNVIITVSGQVRREQILEKAVEVYASMRTAKGAQSRAEKSANKTFSIGKTAFRYKHLRGQVSKPRIALGYRVPGSQHEDHLSLLLLSYMLGVGKGALLQPSAIDESDGDIAVEVGLEARGQRGAFCFVVNSSVENVDRAEVEVLAQLEILKSKGIPASQFDRAKALLLKDYYGRLQTLEQRAYLLSFHEARGSYLGRDDFVDRLGRVKKEDTTRVLNRYFSDSNLALVEFLPEGAEARTFTAKTLLEALRLLVPAVVEQKTDPRDTIQVAEADPTFQIPEFTPNYLKHDLKRTSVLRGPPIWFQRQHTLPLVHLGFFFPGGRINESPEALGITEVALRALLQNFMSREVASWVELERLGAQVDIVNELDFFGFQVAALSPDMVELFGAMVDWTRHRTVEEEDLEKARVEIRRIVSEKKKNPSEGLESARRQVFGEHPYGRDRYGTAESLSALTLEALQTWVEGQMGNVHPLIVIRGDMKGTAFLQDFISKLSNPRYEVRGLGSGERRRESESAKSGAGVVEQTHNGTMTFGFDGPAAGTRQEIMLEVLESALNGPNGLLTLSLRNQANVARQVEILHVSGVDRGAVFAHILGIQDEEKVRESLLGELQNLARVPIQQNEFLGLLVGAITQFHIRRQRGENYIRYVGRNLFAGRGVDHERQYLSAVKNTRADDLSYMVKRYFLPEKAKTVEPAVDIVKKTEAEKAEVKSESSEDVPKPRPRRRRPSLRKKEPEPGV